MGVSTDRAKTPARDMAEQMLLERPDVPYAIYTDMATVPSKTIIGLAVRGRYSALYTVDAAEWGESWERNLALLDSVSPEKPTDANARAHADAVRLSQPRAPGRASAAKQRRGG
jgi:hypothetical protein